MMVDQLFRSLKLELPGCTATAKSMVLKIHIPAAAISEITPLMFRQVTAIGNHVSLYYGQPIMVTAVSEDEDGGYHIEAAWAAPEYWT